MGKDFFVATYLLGLGTLDREEGMGKSLLYSTSRCNEVHFLLRQKVEVR